MIPAAIDLDLLRAYVSVVRHGSLTRTAVASGRSQPTLSMQMRRLESLLGVTLLKRTGRGVVATADGETFLGYAMRMLALGDEAMTRLQASSELQGVVRIALPEEVVSHALSAVLGRLRLTHPGVRLEVVVDDTAGNERLWRDGALDVMIGVPALMPSDETEPVATWSVDLHWVCGLGYTPVEGEPLDLLAFPEPCAWRRRMIQALDAKGQPWRVVFTSRSVPAIQSAVENAHGATVLPSDCIRRPGMRAVPKALGLGRPLAIQYGLYTVHDPRPVARAAVDALLQCVAGNATTTLV